MTRHETFKRRVRERMTKTGERYGAARRALLESQHGHSPDDAASLGQSKGQRRWFADPQQPNDSILAATGRNWDDWADLIDSGPGRGAGHTAIAKWLVDEHGVDAWWAQAVTVGYERITGLRLPGQMPDGSFSVSKSRVVSMDAAALRALLLDDADRAELLPGFETVLRSNPASKSLRIGLALAGDPLGVVMFSLDPAAGERVRITVTHEKLTSPDSTDHWKDFWAQWLAAVDEAAP